MVRLLLDEMLSDEIGEQLRARGHDVTAVVTDQTLLGAPDSAVLAHATEHGRAVVTRNIKDFLALDAQYRAGTATHAGLVLVSTKTFPEDDTAIGALVVALDALVAGGRPEPGAVLFLQR